MKPNKPIQSDSPFLTIAVTGTAGSGKTCVCNRFAQRGASVINADRIAREVVAPGSSGLEKITAHFGRSILNPDGTLDRAALRRRMISDEGQRKALEDIVHPEILHRMETQIADAHQDGHLIVIVEVPLLFELGMAQRFDLVILVRSGRHIQVDRLMARDHVSKVDAESLLHIQMPDTEKAQQSDYVIENNGSVEDLLKVVDRLHQMFYLKIKEGGKIP